MEGYFLSAVGYFVFSLVLLMLNQRWNWIYGNQSIEGDISVMANEKVSTMDEFKDDPGLVVMLIILGPCLLVKTVVQWVLLVVNMILMGLLVILPRWAINKAVRK